MSIKCKPWSEDEKELIISKFLKDFAPNYNDTHQGDEAKWLEGSGTESGTWQNSLCPKGFASPLYDFTQ